ncbi:MAG: amidase [Actinomycetota bacterium]|nr:amidase [Actinomycetota bacterium]
MDELARLDATAQAELVRTGQVRARELVEAAIRTVEELNPVLNAVVTPLYDQALRAVDHATGPFAGVPYLLKDLIVEMAGTPFQEGSSFLRGHVSSYDSELVTRLKAAGLVIIGKTATPEFGMFPTCEALAYGPTKNPWDTRRSTSGSSGGSAAAVASGMVPMAHGNDASGSLRLPAGACGVFGLKPTRARVPLGPEYGDALGGWAAERAVTRSVRDSAALLDATAGAMSGDPYAAPPLLRSLLDEVGCDPGRLRIAWTPRTPAGSPGHADAVAAVKDAVQLLESLGHELVEEDLPGLDDQVGAAIGTFFDAATAWVVAYWTRRVGRSPDPAELEEATWLRWEAGRDVGAAAYLEAVEVLQRFSRVVAAFLTRYDGWLTPTMSAPPRLLGTITGGDFGGETVEYPLVVANITGNPGMSVPLHWTSAGLPMGVHVLGRYGDEATLIRLASQLEQARPWAHRMPTVSVSDPVLTAS